MPCPADSFFALREHRKALWGMVLLTFATGAQAAGAWAPQCLANMTERYRQAEAVLPANLDGLVLNEAIRQNWTGRGGEFWYRRQTPQGSQYVLVAGDGSKEAAFDHQRLATAISTAAGVDVRPSNIDVVALLPERSARAKIREREVGCDLRSYRCTALAVPAADRTVIASAAGDRVLFARDHNIWVRDVKSGAQKRLTSDGEAYFSWGKFPDAGLLTVLQSRGLRLPPFGYSWSPDGRYIVGGRLDERGLEPYPLLQSVPAAGLRPKVHWIRQPLLGERGPRFELAVFDTRAGGRSSVRLPALKGVATTTLWFNVLAWDATGTRFFGIQQTDYNREARLLEVNAVTGEVRILITERSATHAHLSPLFTDNAPNVRLIDGGKQIIWYSQRNGWGHLYRYDAATGRLLNPITRGEWPVRAIVQIDESRQRIYFTAGGREAGDPYQRGLYRVDFDGSDLTLLTPEAADHMIEGAPLPEAALVFGLPVSPAPVSPDGSVFVDTYSTLYKPPVTVLRSTADGRVLVLVESADASQLYARGWKPPQAFTAIAADGKTILHGAIQWPDCPGTRPIPLIDALYGGPQTTYAPHNFVQARERLAPFAKLGFAVFTVDGRGTPLRSKAFYDAGYGNFADVALDDHAAVVRQLLARYPQLDPTRVGDFGHSLGGYISARSLLRYPDVYKVAVSSAGSHSFESMYDVSAYLMPPNYGDGRLEKPSPTVAAENYRHISNSALAKNLRGKLLLVYGDMDENAYPAVTLQFIDALVKANRDYDLLYLANQTHGFGSDAYFIRRRWDYFVEHLLGESPPPNYQIGRDGNSSGPSQ